MIPDANTMYAVMRKYQTTAPILANKNNYNDLCNGAANLLLILEGTFTPDTEHASKEAKGLIKSLQILNEESLSGCANEQKILDAHNDTMTYLPMMTEKLSGLIKEDEE